MTSVVVCRSAGSPSGTGRGRSAGPVGGEAIGGRYRCRGPAAPTTSAPARGPCASRPIATRGRDRAGEEAPLDAEQRVVADEDHADEHGDADRPSRGHAIRTFSGNQCLAYVTAMR